MKNENLDLLVFEKVFTLNTSGCIETCKCGKIYFNGVNSWDWEEGEFESLQANPKAIELPYGITRLEVEGQFFVADCDCWHERALKIINWLEIHCEKIGEYFREIKTARIKQADKLPVDITFPFPEGFRSMVNAPKNATEIQVLMKDGLIQIAHWAQDLSGEEQPPFQGWFIKQGHGYSQIDDPIAWKPKEKDEIFQS